MSANRKLAAMAPKIVRPKLLKSPELEQILELGRRLFGGEIVPDVEMTTRLERWWLSKEFGIPFGECPPELVISILKATLDGNTATLGFVAEKDGSHVPFVAVQVTQRQPETKFTQPELDAVQAYLTARINGDEDDWLCYESRVLQVFIWLAEVSECRHYPIDSDQFRASRPALIPAKVIRDVAHTAKLSLTDARKLPFADLVAVAARGAGTGRKPDANRRQNQTSKPDAKPDD